MKSLIKKKISKKEKGLQGKYFPTEEMLKDQLLKADIFGSNFRFRLLNKEEYLIITKKSTKYMNQTTIRTVLIFQLILVVIISHCLLKMTK